MKIRLLKLKASLTTALTTAFTVGQMLTSQFEEETEKMQILKKIARKIDKKLAKYPAYVKFLKFRDKVAECILAALLAFFNAVGPVWNFLFVKAPNPYKNETS